MSKCSCVPKNEDTDQPWNASSLILHNGVEALRRVAVCICENETFLVVASIILLYTPAIFFSATALGWYTKLRGPAIPVVFVFIATLSLAFFHITSLANPGVIPKQKDIYDAYDVIRMKRKHSNVPQCIEVPIAGKFLRIKYCHSCNIYRPPRSVHCSVCDVCVHRFDHHCKWLGNCVGGHNYKAFYGFISFAFIESIMLVSLSVIRIVKVSNSDRDVSKITESSAVIIYTVASGWFIICLMIYHTYLICTNKTTNEQLKSLYADYNPWNRGIVRNFIDAIVVRTRASSLYRSSRKIKLIYDPGRSVPLYFNPAYLHSKSSMMQRRFAFDSPPDASEEAWDYSVRTAVNQDELANALILNTLDVGDVMKTLEEGKQLNGGSKESGSLEEDHHADVHLVN